MEKFNTITEQLPLAKPGLQRRKHDEKKEIPDHLKTKRKACLPLSISNKIIGEHPVVQTFLTPEGIVMEELLNFMEPAITIRDRNHNYTNYDTSKRYLYPMKVCEANDFIKRGYKMS